MVQSSLNPSGTCPDLAGNCSRTNRRAQEVGESFVRFPGQVQALWHRVRERSRQRQAVWNLTPNELRDLGMTREQILLDTHKPIWKG
jgi:uncharacterized protein YjiS (DUF1127 family)